MEDVKVLVNPKTQSTFQVIGVDTSHGLVGGIRFWLDTHAGKCYIGFRMRIEREQGVSNEGHMLPSVCKTAYPKVKWTGGSGIHGSVAGSIKTDYMPWMTGEILEALKTSDAGGSLHDAFTTVFGTMRFFYNREQFQSYFLLEVEKLLKGDPAQASNGVTIDFMGYTKTSETNDEVEEVVIAEPSTPETTTVSLEAEAQTL